MRKPLFRSGLIRNKLATLTVVNRAVHRGTNIHDPDDKGEGAAPQAQALCTRRQVQVEIANDLVPPPAPPRRFRNLELGTKTSV